jgi:NAD(P)-dependent dehydrogenase (short-subunit alcohol dehydrogenase family)
MRPGFGPTSASTPTWTRLPTSVERFGRVDLVCNNAGVLCEQAPAWEQRAESWRWLIDVKLMGVINGVRTFAPLLIAQAAIEAVEADRVHAIVGSLDSEVVVRQRVEGLLADLV